MSSSPKLTKAWNKFVSLTQGDTIKARVINKGYGYGVDYMPGGVQDISLYRYIKDKNNLIDNTFSGFSPQIFEKINQFGMKGENIYFNSLGFLLKHGLKDYINTLIILAAITTIFVQ